MSMQFNKVANKCKDAIKNANKETIKHSFIYIKLKHFFDKSFKLVFL